MQVLAERATTRNDASERLCGIVTAMLRELRPASPLPPVGLDADIEGDLGLDSLARVELASRIEGAFGVSLPDDAATRASTLRDLAQAIVRAAPRDPSMRRAGVPIAAPEPVHGLPDAAATVVDAFAWHVERHPDREHVTIVEGDDITESLSYGALWTRAGSIALGLASRGIGRGDAVAVMLPTSAAFFEAFLGALLAGAVPVPLYPPVRLSEIGAHVRGRAAILANCRAALLITVDEAIFVGEAIRGDVPGLRDVVTAAHLRETGLAWRYRGASADELALLQYTSGSTGDPKGVMLTHGNLLANIRAMGHAAAVSSTDRFVSWLPLYHDMGLIGAWLGTMYHGVPLAIMPPTSFLARPSRWLRAIHRFRATISAGPNFAYEIAATKVPEAEIEGIDLSSWRLAFNGAEPVRTATLERFAQRYSGHGFDRRALTPVYGLAESAVGLTFPPLLRGPRVARVDERKLAQEGLAREARDPAAAIDIVSCGAPLPGHEVRVVDDAGNELPARSEGRIEFRGPSATTGYLRNPQATASLLRNGWLDTGDVGFIDAGEIFVTSRAKDLIKRGGHNIHPYDLEAAVGEIAGVRKGCVAVFGVPDATTGSERVVVVAETNETAAAVRAALRERIQAQARVHLDGPADEVLLVPARTVLKTSSGKVRRAACRELHQRGTLGARPRAVWIQLAGLAVKALGSRLRRARTTLAVWAYGAYAWSAFAALALAAAPAIALAPRFATRYAIAHRTAWCLLRALRIPLATNGLARLATPEPKVVVVNHSSYVDAIVVMAAAAVPLHFVAKRELSSVPVMGFLLRRLGVHFVDRVDAARGIEGTHELAAAVASHESIVVFPEGTFTRAPGLRPFHLGAFAVAAQTGAPVVPVVLRGTRSLLRAARWLPLRYSLAIDVGEPVTCGGRDWPATLRLRDDVRAWMLARLDEQDLAEPAPRQP